MTKSQWNQWHQLVGEAHFNVKDKKETEIDKLLIALDLHLRAIERRAKGKQISSILLSKVAVQEMK